MKTRTVLENGIKALGRAELQKYVNGEVLSPTQQIKAFCYDCMGGYADGAGDCKSTECPLYPRHPYNPNQLKRQMTEQQRQINMDNLARNRSNKSVGP